MARPEDPVKPFGRRFDVIAGNGYAIEESDDLGLIDPWTEVTGYTTNDSSAISYTLPDSKAKTFARLVVPLNQVHRFIRAGHVTDFLRTAGIAGEHWQPRYFLSGPLVRIAPASDAASDA